jgi:hypothetical protein
VKLRSHWAWIVLALVGVALLPWGSGCRTAAPPEKPAAAAARPTAEEAKPAPKPPAEPPPKTMPVAGKTIQSADGTVSLRLPAGWKPTEADAPLLLRIVKAEPAVGVVTSLFLVRTRDPRLKDNPPLDDLEAALKRALVEGSLKQNLQVVRSGRMMLGDREAITIVSTLTLEGTPAQQKQYFLYVNEQQYFLTGLAPAAQFEKLERLFDGVAASLRISV